MKTIILLMLLLVYSLTACNQQVENNGINTDFEWYDDMFAYHESDDIIFCSKDIEIYAEDIPYGWVLHYYRMDEDRVVSTYRDTIPD